MLRGVTCLKIPTSTGNNSLLQFLIGKAKTMHLTKAGKKVAII